MGLFDKTKKAKAGDVDKGLDFELPQPLAGQIQDVKPAVTSVLVAPPPQVASNSEKDSVLGELLAETSSEISNGQEDNSKQSTASGSPVPDTKAEPAADQKSTVPKTEPGASADIMSIFESEEDDISDLQSLTSGLEDISMKDLYKIAQEVAQSLKMKFDS